MKVILLQDIARIGKKFEIAEVANGYALNRLIPQGLAEPATPENIERARAHEERVAEANAEKEEVFAEVKKKLENTTVTISAEANEKGHLFRGIHSSDIARAVSEHVGVTVPEGNVITDPIKEVGTHEVKLVFGANELSCSVEIEKKA